MLVFIKIFIYFFLCFVVPAQRNNFTVRASLEICETLVKCWNHFAGFTFRCNEMSGWIINIQKKKKSSTTCISISFVTNNCRFNDVCDCAGRNFALNFMRFFTAIILIYFFLRFSFEIKKFSFFILIIKKNYVSSRESERVRERERITQFSQIFCWTIWKIHFSCKVVSQRNLMRRGVKFSFFLRSYEKY